MVGCGSVTVCGELVLAGVADYVSGDFMTGALR
jgi:hypothetical protein